MDRVWYWVSVNPRPESPVKDWCSISSGTMDRYQLISKKKRFLLWLGWKIHFNEKWRKALAWSFGIPIEVDNFSEEQFDLFHQVAESVNSSVRSSTGLWPRCWLAWCLFCWSNMFLVIENGIQLLSRSGDDFHDSSVEVHVGFHAEGTELPPSQQNLAKLVKASEFSYWCLLTIFLV